MHPPSGGIPLPFPVRLRPYMVAGFSATREELHAILGKAHFTETDSTRTCGGDEDSWAWQLPSAERLLLVLQVPTHKAILQCDPPDPEPAIAALGIDRDQQRLEVFPTPILHPAYGEPQIPESPASISTGEEIALQTLIEWDAPGCGVGSTWLFCSVTEEIYARLGDDSFEWLLTRATDPARRSKRENYLYVLESIGGCSDGFSPSFIERAYQIVTDRDAPTDVRLSCARGSWAGSQPILYRPEWVHQRAADLARYVLGNPELPAADPFIRNGASHTLKMLARRIRAREGLGQGRVTVADDLLDRMSSAQTELGRQLSEFGLRTDNREFLRYLLSMIDEFAVYAKPTPDGSKMPYIEIRSPRRLRRADACIGLEPPPAERNAAAETAVRGSATGVRGFVRRLLGKRQPEPPRGPVVITAFHLDPVHS